MQQRRWRTRIPSSLLFLLFGLRLPSLAPPLHQPDDDQFCSCLPLPSCRRVSGPLRLSSPLWRCSLSLSPLSCRIPSPPPPPARPRPPLPPRRPPRSRRQLRCDAGSGGVSCRRCRWFATRRIPHSLLLFLPSVEVSDSLVCLPFCLPLVPGGNTLT